MILIDMFWIVIDPHIGRVTSALRFERAVDNWNAAVCHWDRHARMATRNYRYIMAKYRSGLREDHEQARIGAESVVVVNRDFHKAPNPVPRVAESQTRMACYTTRGQDSLCG